MGRRSRAALAICCAAALLAAAVPVASAAGITHTVVIEAMRFEPATLTVNRGDAIVWINKDAFPHTATGRRKGSFDSRSIAAGRSWKYQTRRAGAQEYLCTLHPTMKGRLIVR